MKDLPKIYDPKKVEDEIYRQWEESGFFGPEKCLEEGVADPKKPYFSIVLPPPNVTGKLHAGHAAMLAIEDSFVRFARMQGRPTLWIPGTDHAAIATQAKVEKIIFKRDKKTRHDLGREKLLEEIESYAQKSHDTIISQTKKMGSSLDWKREAYTLDEKRNIAVNTAFKKMFDDKLIIKKERVVNWCPNCHSTLSDEEVEHENKNAKLYTFKYSPNFPFEISTTRPETKLGDTAVAVNPRDKRYAKYIGKKIETVFCGTKLSLKIIPSKEVDQNFGTGALGVTPAHSMVDWQIAQNENLPLIKVINEDGKITDGFGEYSGKTSLEARKMIVSCLKKDGLISSEEDIENNLSICYRCSSAIEPLPSVQWFVDVHKKFKHPWSKDNISLKGLMEHAVSSKKIEIIPQVFEKTYFHWIENLQDWCIGRQIWFGHRIPVWHKDGEIYCDIKAPSEKGWIQDPDTLDTWFSSGLWTFSTLGWPASAKAMADKPEKNEDFEKYHPTTILETGYDILFFWVARMILMSAYLLEDIPFKKVYLHGLVRDDKGRKMSKSLGNIIDPIDEIEKYGADAFRLSLMLGISPGQDLKLSNEKIESYRNFTNKLWNISRYILQITDGVKSDSQLSKNDYSLSDLWIIKKTSDLIKEVTHDLENYKLSIAGEKLEKYTWNVLADWYIESSKFEDNKETKNALLLSILEDLLKLWHPFIPFITESVWKESGKENFIMIENWPKAEKYEKIIKDSVDESSAFELIQRIITETRNARMENKIDLGKKFELIIDISDNTGFKNLDIEKIISSQENIIISLKTGVEKVTITTNGEKIENAITRTVGGINLYIPLAGLMDTEKEKGRAEKEIQTLSKYVAGIEERLKNKDFVSKAPKKIIFQQKESLAKAKSELASLENSLDKNNS